MAELTVSLSDEHLAQLQAWASQSGLAQEDWIRQHLETLLNNQADSFQQAATHILQKNTELYQRLA